MNKHIENIKKSFGKYGEIEEVNKNEENGSAALIFRCDIDKVIKDDLLERQARLMFIIGVKGDGSAVMCCFGMGTKSDIGKDALKVINQVNVENIYGKFAIDADDDIYWMMSFDADKIEADEVRKIAEDVLISIKKIVMWSSKDAE